MRTVVHNYFPPGPRIGARTRDEPEFVETEHPREKGGQFTSGGGGGGSEGKKKVPANLAAQRLQIATNLKSAAGQRALARTKRFISNTRVQKQVASAAADFMLHHTIGVAGEIATHAVVLSSIHNAIDNVLTHYAVNGPTTSAVAIGVAGYALHEFVDKTGANPHGAIKLMAYVTRSLIARYNRLNPAIAGDAAPEEKEDTVLAGLKQFLEVLEKTSPEDLVKAAKKPK